MNIYHLISEYKDQPIPECQLDALKRFLELKKWALTFSDDVSLVYQAPFLDDVNNPITIVLPSSTQFADTWRMILKALNLLSAIDQCSIASLCQTIMNLEDSI